ncbi:hypothetical protein P43SY_002042 [Pythium insidiosum]|uniref:Bromo domain-containing protein n=1 Tax=Pythium insidiosum TaxID=114742 RepID=A0AAD5MDW3_PYTIN|nr:hypothetical protein P43SY_002042 [Pythium insidiosum]
MASRPLPPGRRGRGSRTASAAHLPEVKLLNVAVSEEAAASLAPVVAVPPKASLLPETGDNALYPPAGTESPIESQEVTAASATPSGPESQMQPPAENPAVPEVPETIDCVYDDEAVEMQKNIMKVVKKLVNKNRAKLEDFKINSRLFGNNFMEPHEYIEAMVKDFVEMLGSQESLDMDCGKYYTEYRLRCTWAERGAENYCWEVVRRYREFCAIDILDEILESFLEIKRHILVRARKMELSFVNKELSESRAVEVSEEDIPSEFDDPFSVEADALRNLDLFSFCDEDGNPIGLEILERPKEERPRIMGFGTVIQHLPSPDRPLPVNPVDTTIKGLEDYSQVIKQPMDLGTIKKKIQDGSYEGTNGHNEFASDVRLVWDNCVLYNGEDSDIGPTGDIQARSSIVANKQADDANWQQERQQVEEELQASMSELMHRESGRPTPVMTTPDAVSAGDAASPSPRRASLVPPQQGTAMGELIAQLQRLVHRQRFRLDARTFDRDVARIVSPLYARASGNVQQESSGRADTPRPRVVPSAARALSDSGSGSAVDDNQTNEADDSDVALLLDAMAALFQHRYDEVRTLAFDVVSLCLTHHGRALSPATRGRVFELIEGHDTVAGDFALRQKALRLLLDDGRTVEPFRAELGWLLLHWLDESDAQSELLSLIQLICRRSPHALDFETVIAVASVLCGRCDLAWARGDLDTCKRVLAFFHVLATHQLEHALGISVCLRTLCCLVNADGHGTWSVMKHLLNGNAGFQVLRGLVTLLEHPAQHSPWVLRGAVFFVGMSSWGSQRVLKLEEVQWAPILLALEACLQCHNGVVVFEIILALQRLIKKYGASGAKSDGDAPPPKAPAPTTQRSAKSCAPTRTIVVEWDIILRMFRSLRPWLSASEDGTASTPSPSPSPSSSASTVSPTATMTRLAPDSFATVVHAPSSGTSGSAPALSLAPPPATATSAAQSSQSAIDPSSVVDATHIPIHQTRIPKELLDTLLVVDELVRDGKFAGDVDGFFAVLDEYLPFLPEPTLLRMLRYRAEHAHPAHHIDWLPTLETAMALFFADGTKPLSVRLEALELLQLNLWSSRNVCEDRVIEDVVLPMLGEVYDDPVPEIRRRGLDLVTEVARHHESLRFDALLDVLENAVLVARHDDAQQCAIHGLVSLFSSYFDHLPATRALRMYDIIVGVVECHRHAAVRSAALACLLHVCEATSDARLQWRDNQLRTSRFLYCSHRAVRNAQTAGWVPVSHALRALLTVMSTETQSSLFKMAVDGLRRMLKNRVILADVDISDVALKLVSCVDYRAFGRAALADEISLLLEEMDKDEQEPALPRRRCTEADITRLLTVHDAQRHGPSSGSSSSSRSVAFDASRVRSSLHDAATQLCKTRFLSLGLETLELFVSYLSDLEGHARDQLFICLVGALDSRPVVADSDVQADSAATATAAAQQRTRTRSMSYHRPAGADVELPTQPASQPSGHGRGYAEPKPVSPHVAFTSRVLSRLSSSTSHSGLFGALSSGATGHSNSSNNSSSSSRHTTATRSAERAQLARLLVLLYEAEHALLHTTSKSLSLLAMLVPDVVTSRLDLLLNSVRGCFHTPDGQLRADAYAVVLELLGNVVHVAPTALRDPQQRAVLELVLVAFRVGVTPATQYLAFRVLGDLVCGADVAQRAALAAIAVPVLQRCQGLADAGALALADSALDLFVCYALAPAAVLPPPALSEIKLPVASTPVVSKSWAYHSALLTIEVAASGAAQLIIRRPNSTTRCCLAPLQAHASALSSSQPSGNADAAERSSRSDRPLHRGRRPRLGRQALPPKMVTPEAYLWRSKAAASAAASAELSPARHVPIPPLPAYDGVGGSPSFFCDLAPQAASEPGADAELSDLDLASDTASGEAETDGDLPARLQLQLSLQAPSSPPPSFDPSHLMLQLFDLSVADRPHPLAACSALTLGLSVLDRTPAFETHKIGVLHVRSSKQRSEPEILGNVGGSLRYLRFVRSLGTITRLQGLEGFAGGMDTNADSDGRYTIVFKHYCFQMVFHVASMMVASDASASSSLPGTSSVMKKKRHIGNDFVHVVFKECDEDYDVQTFSGQFNDVHIVVQPLNDREFRTQVRCKPGLAPFGPLYGTQIIPAPIVADCVRLTCLNANLVCQAFHQELTGFTMNVAERLKQIQTLAARHATSTEASEAAFGLI